MNIFTSHLNDTSYISSTSFIWPWFGPCLHHVGSATASWNPIYHLCGQVQLRSSMLNI